MSVLTIILVLVSVLSLQSQAKTTDHKLGKAGCSISINGGLPNPQPLLLKPDSSPDGYGFYLPANSTDNVLVDVGQNIRLSCTGNRNYLIPVGPGVQEVTAVCLSDASFTVEGRSFTFRELACQSNPVHTARASPTGDTCNGNSNNTIIEIGFLVGEDFIKTLDICFDETKKNALWSKYQLVSGIGGFQSGFPRPSSFASDTFYPGISPETLYTRDEQRFTVSKILGSTALGDKYISRSDDYFMSHGHLTAKADFVYGSQHRATYHYINVAPQWQTFNGGNWNRMEQDVRLFAGSNTLDLIVYTGTHGVTTLPDVNSFEREIWLSIDDNNNTAIPVPKLYWKVVYNPVTKEAIAFVGVNNPYILKPENDPSYNICSDVCSRVSWLKWEPKNIKMGYSYCCEVNECFRQKIKTLREFSVSGLLTK